MKYPLVMLLAVYVSALPVLVALPRARRITGARLMILAWALLIFMMDMTALYFRSRHLYNHFLTYIFTPIQAVAVLWALSMWQVRPVARMTIRLAIPPFLVAWIVLTLLVEDVNNFSRAVEPVYSILALGAAIFTILSRAGDETAPLLRQDWFWICGGLILYFGALAVLTPLGAAYIHDLAMMLRAYTLRAWITVIAFILISIGILCPSTIPSGRSS